jgi:signal peptidase
VHRQNRKALRRGGLLVLIGVPTIFAALLLALVVAVGTNKRIYVVHTGSMTPTIPIKSAVVVEKRSYHVGQIISFRENGAVVTHRFVGLNPDGTLITKGDANTTVDPWKTTRADVIGGVVAAPRELGYWLVYLRNPAGIGSLIGGVICLTLIWSMANSATRSEADADVAYVKLPDDFEADLHGTPELPVGRSPSLA